jgi:hypothetical protein
MGLEGPRASVPRLVPSQYKPSRVAGGVPNGCGRSHALFVSEEEAAEIYARVCRSWYGAKAQSVVDAKIRALQAKAEYKGVEAWKRVARALARHAKTDT